MKDRVSRAEKRLAEIEEADARWIARTRQRARAAFTLICILGLLAIGWLLFVLVRHVEALEPGQAERLQPRAVYVVAGDTIRVAGVTYRLTGFNAPEIGRTAECEREVERGYEAKARLVDLVHSGKPLTLRRVACSCPPSAPEGAMLCNYGRRCGTLRVAGEDVGAILLREGLAAPYPYRWNNVPPRPRWCFAGRT